MPLPAVPVDARHAPFEDAEIPFQRFRGITSRRRWFGIQ